MPAAPGIEVGPGDDCAWLDGLAVSVDTVVQGVHFRLDWTTPQDAGWKAVCAALSDLAASRATPRGALLSLSIAPDELAAGGLADQCMEGAVAACAEYHCPLIGGDVVRTDGPTTLSVTVLGTGTGAPLLRSGAQPGDLVQVSGPTGWAALAVRALSTGEAPPDRALRAHARPRPRLDRVEFLGPATAGIDISDGLLADAARVATASQVQLWLDRQACIDGGPDDAGLSLGGGEDYELLIAAPVELQGFRTVGVVQSGEPGLRWSDGSAVPAAGRGWDHGEAV